MKIIEYVLRLAIIFFAVSELIGFDAGLSVSLLLLSILNFIYAGTYHQNRQSPLSVLSFMAGVILLVSVGQSLLIR